MRLFILAVLGLCACVEADPPALRTLVTVIATQEGQPVEDATQRLAKEGRPALVVIEAALHTAEPRGRRQLLRAIQRVGDHEAEPLLRHIARYDEDEGVRNTARVILEGWAAPTPARSR